MNDVTAKSLLIELQCTNKDITEAQNDALSYVISFLDEIVKEVDKGVALPNTIDNGDKIDGYAYSYKTDSEGVPYINIDSVRAMLTKATNAQPCTLCGNNCQVSLSEQFKVRNELCKEREKNIIPTEVEGLYLNIPEED